MKQLDNDLGGAVNDLAMLLGVAQLRLQQRTYSAVDQIAAALAHSQASSLGSGGSGGSSDVAMAAAVAEAAGVSWEDAAQELGDLKNVGYYFFLRACTLLMHSVLQCVFLDSLSLLLDNSGFGALIWRVAFC